MGLMDLTDKRGANGALRTVKTYGDLRKCAREDAEEILKMHWDRRLPVDPIAVSANVGPSVFSAQLGDDVFGMIIGSGNSADIYIDEDQAPARFRFTCAHELGHYVDRSINGNGLKPGEGYVDARSDQGRGNPDEVYANEFAASLLMPEQQVKQFKKARMSAIEMADRFDVSLSAMSWRLKHLGME